MVLAAIVWYSVGPIITVHGQITAKKYVDRLDNRCNPMIQTLFPNDAVFQDDKAPQSRFEEHEDELQHLPWPAQSQNLNIIEPLWSVLETKVRKRCSPPASLKELEDVFQEEWYRILPETVQNLYQSVPRRTAAVLKATVARHHLDKKKCVKYL
jgi:hypothetical protein